MPVKVGGASGPTAANVASGLVYAADNGARVANMSFGSSSPSTTLETALNYAYSSKVVLVAAAGNLNHNGKLYPAAYSNVIAVSATSRNDSKSSYSSFGDWVDVSAPGGDGQQQTDWILSTLPKTGTLSDPSGYGYLMGTSMASPHVAGLAGLILSEDPSLSNSGVGDLIRYSTYELGLPGIDSYFGFGRIDLLKATHAFDSINQPPLVASAFQNLAAVGPGKPGALGRLLELRVGIIDPEDQLTYSATGMPPSATLGSSTGVFSWKPTMDELGIYNITFNAVEPGGFNASQQAKITTVFKPETWITKKTWGTWNNYGDYNFRNPGWIDAQSPEVSNG